jgi:hypothetical protein
LLYRIQKRAALRRSTESGVVCM